MRAAEEADFEAIARIYAHHVCMGLRRLTRNRRMLRAVGFEFEKWVDTVLMQKALHE